MEEIQSLIRDVSALRTQREKIAQATGERFNIFKVLNLSTNETKTHSAFIAELLNPKGSHGQGYIFLKLFIEQLGIEEFNSHNAIVEIEKFAGNINTDYSEGGRIDIVVDDKNGQGVIIENKIYAGDQKNQLLRYHEYGKSNFSKHHLVYLTLNGTNPSEWSVGSNNEIDKLTKISYKENIITWLSVCQKEATHHPLLRETITQYINLIKELTGQTMDNQSTNEITEKVLKGGKEAIKSVLEIRNSVYPTMVKSIKEDFINQAEEFGKTHEYKISYNLLDNTKWTGLSFYKENWKNIRFRVEFENNSLYYGLCHNGSNGNIHPIPVEFRNEIQLKLGKARFSEHWAWWEWYKKSYEQTLIDMHTGELMKFVQSTIEDFQEKLKGFITLNYFNDTV